MGADFGKAAEQVDLLRERAFPTAMVLPLRFPANPAGVARGLGKLASRYGKPVIAYVKDEGYIDNADLAALVQEGSVCAVKYAIVRPDPRQDPVLADLVQRMGPDLIISGIGERPVIDHFRGFGLRAFTSGSTCVAPALSNRIREALHAGDDAGAAATRELFIPLEDARDAIGTGTASHREGILSTSQPARAQLASAAVTAVRPRASAAVPMAVPAAAPPAVTQAQVEGPG